MNTKLTLAIDKISEFGVVSGSEIFGMGKEFDGDVPKFCGTLRDIVFDADIPERRKKRIERLLIEARRKYKKWSYLNDRKDIDSVELMSVDIDLVEDILTGGWKFYERIVMKSAKKHKGGFWINLDPETLKEIEKSAKANCRSMRQEIVYMINERFGDQSKAPLQSPPDAP